MRRAPHQATQVCVRSSTTKGRTGGARLLLPVSATFTVAYSGNSALNLAAQAEHRDVVKRMPRHAEIHLKG